MYGKVNLHLIDDIDDKLDILHLNTLHTFN